MSHSAPRFDVVVIGAGVAGLAAAWALRHRRVLVLEAADRPGGRVLSLPLAPGQGAPLWLNLGAHMIGGPETLAGGQAAALGLELRPIGGKLVGLVDGERRLLDTRPELYPFAMKLPPLARLSLLRAGLRIRRGAARASAHLAHRHGESEEARLERVLGFENERSFTRYLGPVHPATAAFLRAITERNGADPEDMAAGHALRSFANVWSAQAPGNNLVGGSSRLVEAFVAELGPRLRLGAVVTAVEAQADRVTIGLGYGAERIEARSAVLATPAPVTARIAPSLPDPTRAALEAIRYGAFLSVAVALRPGPALPWQGHYAIAVPGRAFSVLVNLATTLPDAARAGWGSIMLFRGARGAAECLAMGTAAIERRFLADLVAVFPEAAGRIAEVVVQPWPQGVPYAFPGRARLQPALQAPLGRLALAGDYLEFPNLDAAFRSGQAAAARVEAVLERE